MVQRQSRPVRDRGSGTCFAAVGKCGHPLSHGRQEGTCNRFFRPLLFQMMELLDFSVDALVFPDRTPEKVIHLEGLTEQQAEALSRFVDTIRTKE